MTGASTPVWYRLKPARDAGPAKIPKPPTGGWRWGDTERLYGCAATILDAHGFPPVEIRYDVGWRWDGDDLLWAVGHPGQPAFTWLSEECALSTPLAARLWPPESPLRWAMAVRGAFDLHMSASPRADLIPADDPAHAYRIGFELAAFLAAYDAQRQVWPWAKKAWHSYKLRRGLAKTRAAKKAESGWQPEAYTLALNMRASDPNVSSEELIDRILSNVTAISDRRTIQRALAHWKQMGWPPDWPGRFER